MQPNGRRRCVFLLHSSEPGHVPPGPTPSGRHLHVREAVRRRRPRRGRAGSCDTPAAPPRTQGNAASARRPSHFTIKWLPNHTNISAQTAGSKLKPCCCRFFVPGVLWWKLEPQGLTHSVGNEWQAEMRLVLYQSPSREACQWRESGKVIRWENKSIKSRPPVRSLPHSLQRMHAWKCTL